MTIIVISSDPTTGHKRLVIIVILGDLKKRLFNIQYINFHEKNKLTIIFISAQVNNLVIILYNWRYSITQGDDETFFTAYLVTKLIFKIVL